MATVDPATLRSLAARVAAGEHVRTYDILIAAGWVNCARARWRSPTGKEYDAWDIAGLESLDAADALMAPLREKGWRTYLMTDYPGHQWRIAAINPQLQVLECYAPTEAAARVALALLCMAAEGDAGE